MIRAEPIVFEPPRAPVWARPDANFRDVSEAEALFFAGAGLCALDSVAKTEPPWAGAWRARPERLAAAAADFQAPLDLNRAGELAAALRETGGRARRRPPRGRAARRRG